MVTDPESASEIGHAGLPSERSAGRRCKRGEAADGLFLSGEVGQLGADVDVEPEHVELACERVGDERLRLLGREPELRATVTGHDRLVRVRVDSERDADEDLSYACGRGQLGLVRCVEYDRRAFCSGLTEERVVLVVAVDHEVAAVEACGVREGELARRGDVRSQSFLSKESEDGDVRERLRPVEHPTRLADGGTKRAGLLAQGVLAVDDERRSVLVGELRRSHSAEHELASFDPCGIREEIEHPPILTVTLRTP